MGKAFEIKNAAGQKFVFDNPEMMGQELPSAQLRKLSFANLDPTDFEELVFDLLGAMGFVNVDWRKGTPKKASPADGGRDIVAERLVKDVDGHARFEKWFIDAKHYEKGVPPAALEGLMA